MSKKPHTIVAVGKEKSKMKSCVDRTAQLQKTQDIYRSHWTGLAAVFRRTGYRGTALGIIMSVAVAIVMCYGAKYGVNGELFSQKFFPEGLLQEESGGHMNAGMIAHTERKEELPGMKSFTDCRSEEYFVENKADCTQNLQMVVNEMAKCDDEGHFSQNKHFCEDVRKRVEQDKVRCNERVSLRMDREMCEVYRQMAIMEDQRCQDPKYFGGHRVMCESNRIFGVVDMQVQCTSFQDFAKRHDCASLSEKMNAEVKMCQTEMEFYFHHRPACEHLFSYMRKRQHACQSDEGYLQQNPQICGIVKKFTKRQNEKCKEDGRFYENNKQNCDAHELYFLLQCQEECSTFTEYYLANKKVCHDCIRHSYGLQEKCDEESYDKGRSDACEAGMHYIQKQQRRCIESRLAAMGGFCLFIKQQTQELHHQCHEERYHKKHNTRCDDNEQFYNQQLQQRCNLQQYYDNTPKVCRDVITRDNQEFLKQCDSSEYYLEHKIACDSQRGVNERQKMLCQNREASHRQACVDWDAANEEQKKKCAGHTYRNKHVKTCTDSHRHHSVETRRFEA